MEDFEFIFTFLLILGVFVFVGFGILLPIHKKNRQISGDICNHDALRRKYIFKAPMTKSQVLKTLGTHCEIDILSCSINTREAIMHFEWYHDCQDYFFAIQETDDESLILLKAVHNFGGRSQVPSLLNPFMVEKLNASLLPYSQYENAFWD